ncbi:hypothetical protein D3C72_2560590 [compost metagenome]
MNVEIDIDMVIGRCLSRVSCRIGRGYGGMNIRVRQQALSGNVNLVSELAIGQRNDFAGIFLAIDR